MSSTFSEIVDAVAKITGTGHDAVGSTNYVNRAMKLLTPIHHHSDLVETHHDVSHSTTKLILNLPANHRTIRAIKVDNRRFAKRKLPGLVQAVTTDTSHYYYESGQKLVIVGRIHSFVDIAYYRVTPALKYFPLEYRLFRTSLADSENLYEYREPHTNQWFPYNPNDDAHAQAFNRHVNWLTTGYTEVLTNGALSHAYNAKGETDRGSRLFQLFTKDVMDIKKAHESMLTGEQ